MVEHSLTLNRHMTDALAQSYTQHIRQSWLVIVYRMPCRTNAYLVARADTLQQLLVFYISESNQPYYSGLFHM